VSPVAGPYVLTRSVPGARAPILRRYLALAPGAGRTYRWTAHAPLEDVERIAAHFPVFHITAGRGDTGQTVAP
jgi:hypothetical protein